MLVPVACECGKTFRVKEERIGKPGKCPACGVVFVVPFPTVEPEPDARPVPELVGVWGKTNIGDGVLPSDLVDSSDFFASSGPAITASIPVRPLPPVSAPIPAATSKSPKSPWVPSVSPTPDRPVRVIVVGFAISLEDIFVIVFKVWLCLFGISVGFGICVGILYLLYGSLNPSPPAPRPFRDF